jgi:hypothetical protein
VKKNFSGQKKRKKKKKKRLFDGGGQSSSEQPHLPFGGCLYRAILEAISGEAASLGSRQISPSGNKIYFFFFFFFFFFTNFVSLSK